MPDPTENVRKKRHARIVLVDVDWILSMMYSVMRGRVQDKFNRPKQFWNHRSVDPDLGKGMHVHMSLHHWSWNSNDRHQAIEEGFIQSL